MNEENGLPNIENIGRLAVVWTLLIPLPWAFAFELHKMLVKGMLHQGLKVKKLNNFRILS